MVPLTVSKPHPHSDTGCSLPGRDVLLVLQLLFQASSEGGQMKKEMRKVGVDEPQMKGC